MSVPIGSSVHDEFNESEQQMTHPEFNQAGPDDSDLAVRFINDDPDDGDLGRVIGWLDPDIALVMWPGADEAQEERARDLVVVPST